MPGIKEENECTSCDKSFAHPDDLKNHIHTVHEGHKDHKCEFSQVGNLKKHIHIVHEGSKDYKCE